MIALFHGDCLEEMPQIETGAVDMILTDLPYGVTACKWDNVIPFEPMWEQVWRVLKPNGACLFFGTEPFSTKLRASQLKAFKYDWVWNKKIPSGMCNAKIRPMQQTEIVSVFISGKNFYFPIMVKRDKPIIAGGNRDSISGGTKGIKGVFKKTYHEKYPINILDFDKIRRGSLHPTQKPVPLLEYLIKTYTQENETVLDFTMGSGSSGVAALNLKRNFIGIEKDEKYFEIAKKRIQKPKGD